MSEVLGFAGAFILGAAVWHGVLVRSLENMVRRHPTVSVEQFLRTQVPR